MNEPERSAFAEGALSLTTVLRAASRAVETVYFAGDTRPTSHAPKPAAIAIAMARAKGIPVVPCSEEFIRANATGNTHGGLIAKVGERILQTPEKLFSKKNPFLAMLCGIEDPYNFASALRCLYASGCDGVFLTERNFLSAAGIVIRASAGASELLPMAYAPESSEFLCLIAEHNVKAVCAREKRAESVYEADLSRPICLFVGGEKRGVPAELDEKIERGVVIPYGRSFSHSLSADAATAVIAFEILRQATKAKA